MASSEFVLDAPVEVAADVVVRAGVGVGQGGAVDVGGRLVDQVENAGVQGGLADRTRQRVARVHVELIERLHPLPQRVGSNLGPLDAVDGDDLADAALGGAGIERVRALVEAADVPAGQAGDEAAQAPVKAGGGFELRQGAVAPRVIGALALDLCGAALQFEGDVVEGEPAAVEAEGEPADFGGQHVPDGKVDSAGPDGPYVGVKIVDIGDLAHVVADDQPAVLVNPTRVATIQDVGRSGDADGVVDPDVEVVHCERQVAHHLRLDHQASGERFRRLRAQVRVAASARQLLQAGVARFAGHAKLRALRDHLRVPRGKIGVAGIGRSGIGLLVAEVQLGDAGRAERGRV